MKEKELRPTAMIELRKLSATDLQSSLKLSESQEVSRKKKI
jgi:hypothetical protein